MIWSSCAFCGLPVQKTRICKPCLVALPVNNQYCGCCGQPLATLLPPGICCGACQTRRPIYRRARSPYRYAFPVDAALKALKFGHQPIFATVFAQLISPVVNQEFADCDAIIPVPLHRFRQIWRGYNQAYEIGHAMGQRCGLPVETPIRRIRSTRSQSGLSAAARRLNVRGAFRLRGSLTGRHPLIVDDVIATGATCNQLASVLLDAGAKHVSVLTVARAGDSGIRISSGAPS